MFGKKNEKLDIEKVKKFIEEQEKEFPSADKQTDRDGVVKFYEENLMRSNDEGNIKRVGSHILLGHAKIDKNGIVKLTQRGKGVAEMLMAQMAMMSGDNNDGIKIVIEKNNEK